MVIWLRNLETANHTIVRPNKPLQTDERRTAVAAFRRVTLAPLAAERQSRYADNPKHWATDAGGQSGPRRLVFVSGHVQPVCGTRKRMLVVDPWHWLDPKGAIPTGNLRLRTQLLAVLRVIEYGSPLSRGAT